MMTRLTRSRMLLAFFGGLAMLAAACGGDETAERPEDETSEETAEQEGDEASGVDDLDALYEAALDEPNVQLYTAISEQDTQNLIDGFVEEYPGLEVDFLALNSAGIAQRFSAERESGAPSADVLIHGALSFNQEAFANGWTVPPSDLPVPDTYPDDFLLSFGIDGYRAPTIGAPTVVFTYNTELVAEGDIPSTWEDLADPKWRGQILMSDLEEQQWHIGVYDMVINQYGLGEEWAEAFMATEPRVIPGGTVPATELIAAGEAAVAGFGYIPVIVALRDSGAPIDYVVPSPTSSVPSLANVSSEAEAPNAARLFFHYMHTEDGGPRMAPPEGGLFGPYSDGDFEWINDQLNWVGDEEFQRQIRELFGQ